MTTRDDILAIPDERLRNGEVSADYLIFMDFVDAPTYVWTGWGYLQTSGQVWKGIGDVLGIGEIAASNSSAAESVTLTLQAATGEMQKLAREAKGRVKGRDIIIRRQFFDMSPIDENVQPQSPLIPAFAEYTGKMDRMAYTAEVDGDGTVQRTIELSTYGMFSNRNLAANSRWTDADFQRRNPGDKGGERMSLYEGYSPTWTV